MSGFNALAARLARGRRKLEQERASALATAIADERLMPEFAGIATAREIAPLQHILLADRANVIAFPRR